MEALRGPSGGTLRGVEFRRLYVLVRVAVTMSGKPRDVHAEQRARLAIGRHGLTVDHVFQGGSERNRDPEVWTERASIGRRFLEQPKQSTESRMALGVGGGVGAELPNGNRLTTPGLAGWSAFKFTNLNWGYGRTPSGAAVRVRQGFQNMIPEHNRNGLEWWQNVEIDWKGCGHWVKLTEAPTYQAYLDLIRIENIAANDKSGLKVAVLPPMVNPDYDPKDRRRGGIFQVQEWQGGVTVSHEKFDSRASKQRGGKKHRSVSHSNREGGVREASPTSQTKAGRNVPESGRNKKTKTTRRGSSHRAGRARPAGPKTAEPRNVSATR